MKPIFTSVISVGIVTSLLLVGVVFRGERSDIVPKAFAQENEENKGCTNASLNGAYGFFRTGTVPTGPLAAVGIATFDGTGAVSTARQTIRRNGVTTQDLFTGPTLVAPYEIDPDCTGRFLNPDGSAFAHVVVVDGGKELFGISLSDANTVYGVWKKINKED